MSDRIFLSSPDVTEAEEAALLRALHSGWVAPLGPEVDAFEMELAALTDRKHAVALSSGTAALHLALLEAGVQPDTYVLTSSMTFAATANAIVYCGATPVFVDSDETGNISTDLLAHALMDQLRKGHTVSAILPVDLIGKIADLDEVASLAAQHNVPMVVDAAESLGATRNGRPAGSWGHGAILSFNGNKIITTSGGGAYLTNERSAAERVRYLATQARQPVIHYEHHDIGYNYRLSNLLAGFGRAQLKRLPKMMDRRRQWRIAYRELFAPVRGVEIFGGDDGVEDSDNHDNFWLTSVVVNSTDAGWTTADLMEHLAARNIESRPLWKPMHLQPVFQGIEAYLNGNSERFFRSGISLPSGSALTDAQFKRVTDAITSFLETR